MRRTNLFLLACLFLLPGLAWGGVDSDDLPAGSTWYFHADFGEMRDSTAGKGLYDWLDAEVFEELRTELGIDLAREADRITAYATAETGAVIVLDGKISQETKDKALAAAAGAEHFETLKSRGKTYYYLRGDGEVASENVEIDGLGDEWYFSFDIKNKLLVASDKDQLETLLGNKGRIAGAKSHDGALFVLTAEKSLIQAGMDTDSFGDEDGGFDSNILRNTEQVALMIADVAGKIAIEAQLVAAEPEMAESLASIVRGLIALQAFSDDMDPDVSSFLRGTRVDVDNKLLKISVALAPEVIAAVLDDA